MEILLKKILDYDWIKRNDKILIVCGNENDDRVLKNLKFTNYLITAVYRGLPVVKHYKQADAQNLPFVDRSFDVIIVNAGLHHCDSPHKALTEMYRVAKKAVIVHEAQDSWFVRLMVKLKLVFDYETGAVGSKGGGLNDTAIPNFIYRWTTREVEKTINSYDPTKIHKIVFFRSFHFYPFYLESGEYFGQKIRTKFLGKRLTEKVINLVVFLLNFLTKNQGNDFAFIIRKDKSPYQSWINKKELSNKLSGRFKA